MPDKKPIVSVTAKDFDMQTFTCPGHGGGGKDTSRNGVRLVHRDSGAVGEGREHRSLTQNRKSAFIKLANSSKFQQWIKIETARRSGQRVPETPEEIYARVDKMIENGLRDGTIVVEEY